MQKIPELPRIVFDTEYTTWQGAMARGWTGPGERREVIQIGALLLAEDMTEARRFSRIVRPVFNPKLSDYCIDLTGITQELVETEGVPFVEALEEFKNFVGDCKAWSYGRDCDVLSENCDWHGIELEMSNFGNVRDIARVAGYEPSDWTSGTLYRIAGEVKPAGQREHDALDDCLSIATFLRWVMHGGRSAAVDLRSPAA